MTGNWYELAHAAQHHHQELMREARDLRRAAAARRFMAARRAAARAPHASTAVVGFRRPTVLAAAAARLGTLMVSTGRKLQAMVPSVKGPELCDICGGPTALVTPATYVAPTAGDLRQPRLSS